MGHLSSIYLSINTSSLSFFQIFLRGKNKEKNIIIGDFLGMLGGTRAQSGDELPNPPSLEITEVCFFIEWGILEGESWKEFVQIIYLSSAITFSNATHALW